MSAPSNCRRPVPCAPLEQPLLGSYERSSICRRHCPRGRLPGMPLAHECSGARHYPCGLGPLREDRRRRENAGPGLFPGGKGRQTLPMGAIGKRNWMHGTAFPPDSAAPPRRMHCCRDAENRVMSVSSKGNQGAGRILGARKSRKASDIYAEYQSLARLSGRRKTGRRPFILRSIAFTIARNLVNIPSHPPARRNRNRARHFASSRRQPFETGRFFRHRPVPSGPRRYGAGPSAHVDFYAR